MRQIISPAPCEIFHVHVKLTAKETNEVHQESKEGINSENGCYSLFWIIVLSHVPYKRIKFKYKYIYVHIYLSMYAKVKVKDFRNRPGVAQRVPGGLGSQIP